MLSNKYMTGTLNANKKGVLMAMPNSIYGKI
jgi:hypothetical protein